MNKRTQWPLWLAAAGVWMALATPAVAAEKVTPNSLSSDSGAYSFGYVSNGDKAVGPFLLDTASGRMWQYQKVKRKTWALVPVKVIGQGSAPAPTVDDAPMESAAPMDEGEDGA